MNTIQTISEKKKTEIMHNGKTVQLMEYQGQLVNSHTFSPEQNFLLKCRSGLKIREYSIEDFIDLVFNKICVYTGVKFLSPEDRKQSAAELIEMLLKNYPEKYSNEIVGSYFLADKKRLVSEDNTPIELFRMVDYRQCSDLLQAFDRYFKKQFEPEMKGQKFWYLEQVDTRPTKEEIEQSFMKGLNQALEIVKSGQKYDIAGTDLFLYAELKERGIIILTEEEIDTEINAAYKVYKSNLNFEKFDKKTQIGRKSELTKLIETALPTDIRVKNIARRKILNDYLQTWALSDFTVNDILK